MHRIFRVKAYEAEHGPHFNEEHARKAVSKMENEDGTRGPHWSVEETTALASQYGINLGSRFNRYDWFVALNMVYSDYYKVIISMTNSNSTKHFVELADEEMAKCQTLLDKLGVDNEPAKENDKIIELQKEVNELKNIIRKANQMVPPPMKEMLPQDMKNAMDKVGQ